jgi:hypothetical protein
LVEGNEVNQLAPVTWVIESAVMPNSHPQLKRAITELNQRLVGRDDDWWVTGAWPSQIRGPIVFHGSLGNADRIERELSWRPGAFCRTTEFHCSRWYSAASAWLLHQQWVLLPAREFVENASSVFEQFGSNEVFVRPDSPLKPFAGRVLGREKISLEALDFGFYFDDPELPVNVAPTRTIGREWRYVVAEGRLVGGSAYSADGRIANPDDPKGAPWRFAEDILRSLRPPEEVYVLDLCEADGELKLLELNPFSGADLYACNAREVVTAVSSAAAAKFLANAHS